MFSSLEDFTNSQRLFIIENYIKFCMKARLKRSLSDKSILRIIKLQLKLENFLLIV